MNIGFIFLSALLMFVATKISKNLGAILTLGALLPFLLIILIGGLRITNASPEAAQEVANQTISETTNYFGDHIGEWIVEDMFGTLIGAVVSAFTGK